MVCMWVCVHFFFQALERGPCGLPTVWLPNPASWTSLSPSLVCVGVPAVTRPPSYERVLQVVFFEPQRPTDWMKVYGRVDARGQVVKMERNTEKGLFAALDQKLKAEKVRLKVWVPGGLLARRGMGQEGGGGHRSVLHHTAGQRSNRSKGTIWGRAQALAC